MRWSNLLWVYVGLSEVASMVSDDHAIVWLLAVLAALCPMRLYWYVKAVLVGWYQSDVSIG